MLIVLGAACFFLSNVLLKHLFNPTEYGQYSIVLTYFSIVNLMGLLGGEQVFVRHSQCVAHNVIETQRVQFFFINLSIIISSIVGFLLFQQLFSETISLPKVLLFVSTFAMVSLLFLFNIFRLNNDFSISQLVLNAWKMFLLIMGLLLFAGLQIKLNLFLYGLMAFIVITALFSLVIIWRKIEFKYNHSLSKIEYLRIWYQFFISILLFTVLLFGERFIIEYRFGIEEFGTYFYMTNLFIAPFALLQNYIGFKQVIAYKVHFDWYAFKKLNFKIIGLGILISILLFLIQWLIPELSVPNTKYYSLTMLNLLFLGVNRIFSATFLAAFEANTTREILQKTNLFFLGFSLAIFAISYYVVNEIWQVILLLNIMWAVRTLLLYYYLKKLLPKTRI